MVYHAFHLIGKPTQLERIHAGISFGNIHFYWGSFTFTSFLPAIRHVMSLPGVRSGRDPVVLDLGSWDISRYNITYFATVAVPALRSELAVFQRAGAFTNAKVNQHVFVFS